MSTHAPPAPTTNLFLIEDLEDVSRTSKLAKSDFTALHAVADWINSFVVKPNTDIGRAGPVCPFVPGALERKTLWLAPEQIANRNVPDVVQIVNTYKSAFLTCQPLDGEAAIYKSFVVVFTDLSTDRAKGFFDGVLQELSIPSYVNDGLVLGPFYESNEATAIYNSTFRPFTPPVPFLLMRQTVISDWKFFLDNKEWLNLWARHFGESAALALAEELRRFPWRSQPD